MFNEKKSKFSKCKWGDCVLDGNFWNEFNAPIVKIKEFSDIDLNDSEKKGILSDKMIGACLSYLSKCPADDNYALIKCNLSNMKLVDVRALKNYKYLQYLNVSDNNLTDLSPLGHLSYLVYLDASYNKLTSLLKFSPPEYLTHVNLSHNNITIMDDLRKFWSIVYLNLSHNCIEVISGLKGLKHLKHLNLSSNLIECVENLDGLNIEHLNLDFNSIKSFRSSTGDGFENILSLRSLFLSHNVISSLSFFQSLPYSLRIIDLSNNKIADLLEVSNLTSFIDEIDLRGNSCTTWPHYREVLLYAMPTLTCIDGCDVAIPEKVSATTKFSPPIELLASRILSKLILLEQLSPTRIDGSVTPYDQDDPILIVLSGPSAVKKILIGLEIAKKIPNVKYCRSFTTRQLSANYGEEKAYKFVEREVFNEMARNGEFLTIEELVGDSYGFQYLGFHWSQMKDAGEISTLRQENKIGITQMDLCATLQLKHRYPNVKLILVVTKDEEIHREWIRGKFRIFTWIKDSVENLLALTIGKSVASENQVESSMSRMNFVSNIVDQIIEDLDLPMYCNYIRPQGTGATATDIIFQSRMMLPRATKTEKELMEERKHIKFNEKINEIKEIEEISVHSSDLKVILDEHMNIIIDDEESKRKKRMKRLLHRKRSLEVNEEIKSEITSESSDESHYRFSEKFKRVDEPKYLMNTYIEIVMKSRELYIDKHLKNPGFYSLVVFSDEYKCTLKTLGNFVKEQLINAFHEKCENPDIEYRNKMIMPKVIDKIVNEINTIVR